MGALQSNLSNPQYGYDFVVAVTQASINATMDEYLSTLKQPVVEICYVADASGNPVPIDFATLLSQTGGVDPFTIPATADPATDSRILALRNCRFMVGIKAQIGLPPMGTLQLPNVVNLGNNTATVGFNMLCSIFEVVQLTVGGYSGNTWTNESQPVNAPWIFQSTVNMAFSTVNPSDYSNLPAAVYRQLANKGSMAFSVQQLLFDLSNAAFESAPRITNIHPGTTVYTILNNDFVNNYFITMKANGQPMLGCTVVSSGPVVPSTLEVADFAINISPVVDANGNIIANPTQDQSAITTLTYLCTSTKRAINPVRFDWNWIDPSEIGSYNGVVAVNRDTFVNYLQNTLASYVNSNCYTPTVKVSLNSWSQASYDYNMYPNSGYTIEKPNKNGLVLIFNQNATAYDQAGLHGDIGKMSLTTLFNMGIYFTGNKIKIVQMLRVNTRISVLATTADGNIIDIVISDEFDMSISSTGELVVTKTSNVVNNSETPGVGGFLNFFTHVNQLSNDVATWAKSIVSVPKLDIPLSTLQNFNFPGGNSFAFSTVQFSNYLDLVAHITYTDPT